MGCSQGRKLWLTIGLVGLTISSLSSAFAAKNVNGLRIEQSRITGKANFVTAQGGGEITMPGQRRGAQGPQARDFLLEHGELFGLKHPDDQLQQKADVVDQIGHRRNVYTQVHKGVRVFGGELHVHRNAQNQFIAANGDIFDIPDQLATNPQITVQQAEAIAIDAMGEGTFVVQQSELLIVDTGWYGGARIGAKLAWQLVMLDEAQAIREGFFIDASNGKILDRWNLLQHTRKRYVYDAHGISNLPGSLSRWEGRSAVSNTEVNNAYDYAGDFYDYLYRAFGRDSLDDSGLPIYITVDWGHEMCPNAYWDGTRAVFCDGVVTDDIVAHELGHGLTDYTANLIYQYQPGQLNESYSDIWGELVDLFNGNAAFADIIGGTPTWPSPTVDPGTDSPNASRVNACSFSPMYSGGVRWLNGEDSTGFNGAIRDMWRPTCYGDPDRGYSSYQTCSEYDNGGVHSGSGIPNHAFAMVTDGKTFNGYTVTGIGPIKSGAVWYRALTAYLTPISDFQAAYNGLTQAAIDLIDTYPNDPRTGLPSDSMFTAFDAQQVDLALQAVEMDADGACGAVADFDIFPNADEPIQCHSRVTIFGDDFENGINGWTVSNTSPPTPYDWIQTTSLPDGVSGTAWFCADANIGDCGANDQTAAHWLTSPEITIPNGVSKPMLVFSHHMLIETGWDGGNISIKVDGGAWTLIPASAFEHNAYNMTLYDSPSTNPLGGEWGWSGATMFWGKSLIDLSSFASGGEVIQIRFNFGKDGCDGIHGWYVDDFEVYYCSPGDYDGDGDIDMEDFGLLQRCYSELEGPLEDPSCDNVSLDGDDDVDLDDHAIFVQCMSGANVPVDPGCLDN